MDDARRAIEEVARHSYGRLVSYLSSRWRDLAAIEDALSEAFLAAMRTWPEDGVPDKPEAWLLTAARHRLIDHARHDRMRSEAEPAIRQALDEAEGDSLARVFPDERLKLLFVCAHPAIDRGIHAPLMLQVVFGLDAQLVARAFLVSPTTLSQRLVRAKAKIRDAGIAFDVPVGTALAPRLEAVLEAIYAAYGSGWDDLDGADPRLRGLTEAALMLARVLIELLPDEPEALGLLALMLYCEARRESRRDDDGAYVPLSEQVVERWSAPMIEKANRALSRAAAFQRPARFQLEAAIQAAHLERARTGAVDWEAIATLYEGLVRSTGALGAFVGRAAAVAELRGAADALALLDDIPAQRVKNYQPYWALRAHLLQRLHRPEADEAFELAIGLAEDPAIRRFLHARRHAAPAGR